MPFRLCLGRQLFNDLLKQAQAEYPLECFGLLGGVILPGESSRGLVLGRYPMVNVDQSRTTFRSDPREMLAVDRELRQRQWDVLAVYHSHPTSDPIPSQTDLKSHCMYYDSVSLIVSLKGDTPTARAWWLSEDSYREADWEIIEEE